MQTGDKIKWRVGDKIAKGIFRQQINENELEVVCYEISGVFHKIKTTIEINAVIA